MKKILRLIRLATKQDIVSVLNRYFKKIELMYENDLVALYHTVSALNIEENDATSKLIPRIKTAIIARMITLISLEQEKIAKNLRYNNKEFESSHAKQIFATINGPVEQKITTMRKKFYAVTNDGSFFET